MQEPPVQRPRAVGQRSASGAQCAAPTIMYMLHISWVCADPVTVTSFLPSVLKSQVT